MTQGAQGLRNCSTRFHGTEDAKLTRLTCGACIPVSTGSKAAGLEPSLKVDGRILWSKSSELVEPDVKTSSMVLYVV